MDPEAKAIADIVEILSPLEPESIQRVLNFITHRYQTKSSASGTVEQPASDISAPVGSFSEFHELFYAANPSTAVDRALVAAYWFQKALGQDELDAFALNKELKYLGHPSTNIARDLDALIGKTPRLVVQTRKEGSRRRYKLTREGIRAVEKMLTGQSGGE